MTCERPTIPRIPTLAEYAMAKKELEQCKRCNGTKEIPGKPEYPGTRAWPETCPDCEEKELSNVQ